jgi:hypothetical protein
MTAYMHMVNLSDFTDSIIHTFKDLKLKQLFVIYTFCDIFKIIHSKYDNDGKHLNIQPRKYRCF